MEELSRELKDFRNGLRDKDREAFDELIETARTYSDAGHNAGFLDPTQAALLSMLVGIERRLEELEERAPEG